MLTNRTGPSWIQTMCTSNGTVSKQFQLSSVWHCMTALQLPTASRQKVMLTTGCRAAYYTLSAYTESSSNTLDQPNACSEPARTITRTGLFTSIWCSCKASELHRDAPKALPASCLQTGTLPWFCLVFSNVRQTRSKFYQISQRGYRLWTTPLGKINKN